MKKFKDKFGIIRGRVYESERGFIVEYGCEFSESKFCKFFATDSRVMKTEKQAINILKNYYNLVEVESNVN